MKRPNHLTPSELRRFAKFPDESIKVRPAPVPSKLCCCSCCCKQSGSAS